MRMLAKLVVGTALSLAALAGPVNAQGMKIGLVVKSLGNGFFEAANKGVRRPRRSSAASR